MGDIHIWLFATQIVGLSIIVMFAVYVLLSLFDTKKIKKKPTDGETAINGNDYQNENLLQTLVEIKLGISNISSRIDKIESSNERKCMYETTSDKPFPRRKRHNHGSTKKMAKYEKSKIEDPDDIHITPNEI